MCFSPKCNPTIRTIKERINRNNVNNLIILDGRSLKIISIDTNPPQRYALGAIKPVIHNIKNRAASSGQDNAELSPYLKKTCMRIIITISPIEIHASCLPRRKISVLKITSPFRKRIMILIRK